VIGDWIAIGLQARQWREGEPGKNIGPGRKGSKELKIENCKMKIANCGQMIFALDQTPVSSV